MTSVNYSDDKLLFTNDGSSLVAIAKIDISCSISLAFVICYQQTSSCQSQTTIRNHSSFEAIDAQAIHESTKVSFCIFFTNSNAIRKRIPFARNATIIFSLSFCLTLYDSVGLCGHIRFTSTRMHNYGGGSGMRRVVINTNGGNSVYLRAHYFSQKIYFHFFPVFFSNLSKK